MSTSNANSLGRPLCLIQKTPPFRVVAMFRSCNCSSILLTTAVVDSSGPHDLLAGSYCTVRHSHAPPSPPSLSSHRYRHQPPDSFTALRSLSPPAAAPKHVSDAARAPGSSPRSRHPPASFLPAPHLHQSAAVLQGLIARTLRSGSSPRPRTRACRRSSVHRSRPRGRPRRWGSRGGRRAC